MSLNKQEILLWIDKHLSKQIYRNQVVIHDDLTVDIDSSISLKGLNLAALPFQFGIVHGDFVIERNGLTSLKGCPVVVGGRFIASDNELSDLEHFPSKVGDSIFLDGNQIRSVKGLPRVVKGCLVLDGNPLGNLEHHLLSVRGDVSLHDCGLTSISNMPEVEGNLYLTSNKIGDFTGLKRVAGDIVLSDLDTMLQERCEAFGDGQTFTVPYKDFKEILRISEIEVNHHALNSRLPTQSPSRRAMKI